MFQAGVFPEHVLVKLFETFKAVLFKAGKGKRKNLGGDTPARVAEKARGSQDIEGIRQVRGKLERHHSPQRPSQDVIPGVAFRPGRQGKLTVIKEDEEVKGALRREGSKRPFVKPPAGKKDEQPFLGFTL